MDIDSKEMRQLGEQAKMAMARIATEPSMKPFLEFLGKLYVNEIDELTDGSIDKEPCATAQRQGTAKAFRFLLDMFKKSQIPDAMDDASSEGRSQFI